MSNDRRAELRLTGAAHPAAGERAIAVAAHAAARLSSVQTWTLSTAEAAHGARFTREVPGASPESLSHLDEVGVVGVGTAVVPGTVLVGRVRPASPFALGPEARALGAPVDVEDISLRCPPDASGTVVAATLVRGRRRKDPRRAEVTIRCERPLAVGDALVIDGASAPVGAIVEAIGGADAAWPGVEGTRRVLAVRSAEQALHARGIGPYSLITQQPLGTKARHGGQTVGPEAIAALRACGAVHTLHELLTVKSDDVEGRMRLYESIVMGEPRCVATLPRSARVLERELVALGFEVDFDQDAIGIRTTTTEAIRESMPGVVRKPETLNYRTLVPEAGGLFCEEIFGALDSDDRALRLGRIELPAPVLHPFAMDAVAALLGLTITRLRKILECAEGLDGDHVQDLERAGAAAVRDALGRLDLPSLATERGGRGEIARALVASGTDPTTFVLEAWPVLPPDLRPLVPLDDGSFATSDLNDLYRRVVNRAMRMRRLVELDAPGVILCSEHGHLQRSIASLVENGFRGRTVRGPSKRPLRSLADMLQGPDGRFAMLTRGKRADYSAIAHAVACPDLPPTTVRLPRAAALELFRPWAYGALDEAGLVTRIREAKRLCDARAPEALAAVARVATGHPVILFPADADGSPSPVAALEVDLWDAPAIGLPFAAHDRLGRPSAVVAHVPIDPRAVEEARTRLRDASPGSVPSEEPSGWIARAALAEGRLGPLLFEAAVRGEVDPARDPATRLLLGRLV